MSKRYKFSLAFLCFLGVFGLIFALQKVLSQPSQPLVKTAEQSTTIADRTAQLSSTDNFETTEAVEEQQDADTEDLAFKIEKPSELSTTLAPTAIISTTSPRTVEENVTSSNETLLTVAQSDMTRQASESGSVQAARPGSNQSSVASQPTASAGRNAATAPAATGVTSTTAGNLAPTTTAPISSTTVPTYAASSTTTSPAILPPVTTTAPTAAPTTPVPTTVAPTTAVPTTVPAESCGAYWGAYVDSFGRYRSYDAASRLKAINYVEDQMGRTFDVDHQFYRWDDFVSNHNIDNYIKPSIAQGRKPFLSWKPVYRDNTNIAWTDISDGNHDALIRQKAQQVKSIGTPIILVFGHEADARVGTFQPGKVTPVDGHIKADAGSAAEFAAAYRHVHSVFAQEGVTNVEWAWIMTRAPFEPNAGARSADLLYPGDEYVDIVGLDPYNFFFGGNWREMKDLMGGFTDWNTTRNNTQPWMIAEWGSVEDPNQPGRKAQWLRNAADYFESEERVKYIIHFDSFPTYNWLFDSSASSAAAWKEISNRDHFNCPAGADIPNELAFADAKASVPNKLANTNLEDVGTGTRNFVLVSIAALGAMILFAFKVNRRPST